MLRFFDKEVACIYHSELDRELICKFFEQADLNEIICVLNESGQFEGFISYYSMSGCVNIEKAILPYCLELNKEIWKNARDYIKKYRKICAVEHMIIPIVDSAKNLLCFAYDDIEANREVRMLKELSELRGAYQFKDIYPSYECVKIYGFNELAFYFAKYLRELSIDVLVYGEMWNGFFESSKCRPLDFKCFNVWAEGNAQKSENWIDNEQRSAAAYFECIDEIYEQNIKLENIQNAAFTKEDFLDYLRKCGYIVIMGTGIDALNAYNYLLMCGIDIFGFASEECKKQNRQLFGKKVFTYCELKVKEEEVVWINVTDRGSAWGIGETDYFDYIGYSRNKQFFLIRDYIEVACEGIPYILKGKQIVCIGDALLWENVVCCLKKNAMLKETSFEYYEYTELEKMVRLINENTYVLWAAPEETEGEREWEKREWTIKKKKTIAQLEELGINHYSDYFCSLRTVIGIQKNSEKYSKWAPKRIVIGATRKCCGASFIRELLDNHPCIMMIAEYNSLNMEMFWYCARLSGCKKDDIMPSFWKIYKGELTDRQLFHNKMLELLKEYEVVTPQDLFVMFHLANYYMHYGKDMNICNSVIYWEPHYSDREFIEREATKWLSSQSVPCSTLSLVRNAIQRCGSEMKGMLKQKWFGEKIYLHKVYALILDWLPDIYLKIGEKKIT